MFDIGFLEMLVVAVLALLVLGPERLPGAIRTVSLTIGRIKRGFSDVRNQVEREIGADEIRQQLNNERIMAELEKSGLNGGSPAKSNSNVKPAGQQSVTQTQQTTQTPVDSAAEEPDDQQAPRHEQP
ncbi:Sec-independent protein translocase protein TatB [Pseudomonas neustonica]|jgi:sec-independent protein translocase protein TatB|uniref:Sec-independent protein translocase protein TatB n=1 Tax=Pseudomonas neustonica TaxID=2487346 RepID=A0ABX9XG73_9PSED|nr:MULTISPECIES: Sec-independent protein translocase protein TatB [Pseudomonas]MBA6419167.1 twin-arginine translocase subunit TatB [Pseudomonas sp. 5Ae-yellow]ROZ81656.1 twin-arginine translocase subunit TatB [Pseudomonas sp. SSM44]ROZ83348.1 twin-arginine translocase subunit TatB [Pseudomonas neustonica]|tara:strand:- start:202 stop:582 length:381 start_codon:yes stop_codon:yes gene_type:complete